MSTAAPKRFPGTLEDLARLRDTRAVELIEGEIVEKAVPSLEHGFAQLGLGGQLRGPFHRRKGAGGPGGWWIATEVEVYYEDRHVYRHDVVGWRRERMPVPVREMPVRMRPDWVCEVLSTSNAGNDLVKKLRILHRHAMPHYWIADPTHRTLTIMRWNAEAYLTVMTAADRDAVRGEPFEEIELRVETLFERGEDEGG